MPKHIGVIDLMMSIPISDDNHEYYEFLKSRLRDTESREGFKMPAEYMFKDIPKTHASDDKVAWLVELERQKAEKEKVESGKMKNEWGSQIRSYVLDDRRVKDHRTGYQTSQTDAVLAGDLDGFLKAFLMNKTTAGVDDSDD